MKKLLLILPLILLAGCEYRYRYPCQDPANWGKPECNNEACKADGECTSHTLGLPDNTMPTSSWNRPPPGTPRFGQDSDGDGIPDSMDTDNGNCNKNANKNKQNDKPSWRNQPPKQPSFQKSSQSEDYGDAVAMKTRKADGQSLIYREPPGVAQEKPLTMDTIVNTKAHNEAAS